MPEQNSEPKKENAGPWFYAWRELGTFLEQQIQDGTPGSGEQEAFRAALWRMNQMEMQIVDARIAASRRSGERTEEKQP